MNCDRLTQVHAYHDGELPAEQRAALEAHMRACAECSELLGELQNVSRMLAAAPILEMSPEVRARLEQSWWASRDRGVLRVA